MYLLSGVLFFSGEGAEMTEGGSQGTQLPSNMEPNVEKYCRERQGDREKMNLETLRSFRGSEITKKPPTSEQIIWES